MPDELILEVTTNTVLELEVGTPGPPGRDGTDGTDGDGSGSSTQNTYIQQTEPTPAVGSGAFIWYQTNAGGVVLDIRKGSA